MLMQVIPWRILESYYILHGVILYTNYDAPSPSIQEGWGSKQVLGEALVISYSMAVKGKTVLVAHEEKSSFSFIIHGS